MTAPAHGGTQIWTFDGLNVHYREELDGAGTRLAGAFVACVAEHSDKPVYDHAFEWCAGPGFIGFALLARGLCRRLTLCDVNPAAIECVRATVESAGLGDRVTYAAGPDLEPLDPAARFDLVVANPPNFFALNPRHPSYAALKDDLRPNDPGWRVHRAFYANVGRFLTADARLFVSEVNLFEATVFIPPDAPEPYDVRPRAAIDDFEPMIAAGGLETIATADYFTGRDGARLTMMIEKPRA